MSHASKIIVNVFLGVATVGLLYWAYRRLQQPGSTDGDIAQVDPAGSELSLENVGYSVVDAVTGWEARGAPYKDTIYTAAARYGVPGDLLFRVAYQESRFRDDIINGSTKSAAGALGMFQFMPATANSLGIDPLNVTSAANGAAQYLSDLHSKFGTWSLALMAYNWGPGNVSKYLAGIKSPPSETQNYVAQITSDVGYA